VLDPTHRARAPRSNARRHTLDDVREETLTEAEPDFVLRYFEEFAQVRR
jgi:hypothetical protein